MPANCMPGYKYSTVQINVKMISKQLFDTFISHFIHENLNFFKNTKPTEKQLPRKIQKCSNS